MQFNQDLLGFFYRRNEENINIPIICGIYRILAHTTECLYPHNKIVLQNLCISIVVPLIFNMLCKQTMLSDIKSVKGSNLK